MKILKEGKKVKDIQTLYFICYYCGCEYSCETSEKRCHRRVVEDVYIRYRTYYTYDCPNCNVQNIGMTIQEYLELGK